MSLALLNRLQRKLRLLDEENSSIMGHQDRQEMEDRLFHTIGPLTQSPKWSEKWTSPTEPPPDFVPGGPSPQWTPEEVVFAMAGDPNLAFRAGGKDNPRSPAYGRQGGSPLWRVARRVSRIYNRDRDPSFIADMYSNGFIPLVRMMQPGFDESRSPFISYAIRHIQSAMEHGIGGTGEGIRAKGGESTTGVSGLQALLKATTPEEAKKIAEQIKGKFQTTKSHEKHEDNPFGAYSNRVYDVAMRYAKALESGDEDSIEKAKNQINQLIETIEDEQVMIPGASTGMGQAISTGDRKSHIGVSSMDVQKDEESGPMAGNIPTDDNAESWLDPESVFYILDMALARDVNRLMQDGSPRLMQAAKDAGWNFGEKLGKMTTNELRYIIRQIGPLGSNYPGKGTPRKNITTPRDAAGWITPGKEDPEIEPIPTGGLWHSIWSRGNNEPMGPTAIAQEISDEVREFQKLGIKTVRTIKVKANREEAISKVAVANTVKSGLIKLKVIAAAYRDETGVDESKLKMDSMDRYLITETFDWLLNKINRNLKAFWEEAPPGLEHIVDRENNKSTLSIAWSK